MKNRRIELAPCGVFCKACPSFNKTCLGCSSDSKNQKRKSKWSCKIRKCCYEEKKIDYCGYCGNFPCEKLNKKLINSHKGENNYRYRHEIPENMKSLRKHGIDKFIKLKREEFSCPICKNIVYFYHYKCSECGKELKK
jgi:hypothetical protein